MRQATGEAAQIMLERLYNVSLSLLPSVLSFPQLTLPWSNNETNNCVFACFANSNPVPFQLVYAQLLFIHVILHSMLGVFTTVRSYSDTDIHCSLNYKLDELSAVHCESTNKPT